MKQLFVVAMLVLATSPFAMTQTRTYKPTERELLRINSELSEAGLRGEKATAERLIADNYIYTGLDGNIRTKAQVIQNMQPLPTGVKYSSRIEDAQIRDFGS